MVIRKTLIPSCNLALLKNLLTFGCDALFEHLWRDLKIAVQRGSSSNLRELERISREEWEKLSYRCAKLVV